MQHDEGKILQIQSGNDLKIFEIQCVNEVNICFLPTVRDEASIRSTSKGGTTTRNTNFKVKKLVFSEGKRKENKSIP